jgi:hypothetical protein
MKPSLLIPLTIAFVLEAHILLAVPATQIGNASRRIGVYDSRVIAYAWFWSADHQSAVQKQIESGKAAKAAGDTAKFKELDKALSGQQAEMHRQVFSTAPAIKALVALKDRLPEIEKQAGVSALVSKWDDAALKQNPSVTQVDVTDLLASEFKPGEKQLKTIQEIKKQKPVPLDKIDKIKDL